MEPSDILPEKISGFYAWFVMATGIFLYDMFAIKTKKCQTMSTALWEGLGHPKKSVPLILVWLTITHHLFGNSNARSSYKKLLKVK